MHVFKKYFSLTVFFVLLFCPGIFAQDISVTAEVETNTITLGSTAQLTIKVNGSQKADPVQIPSIDGLEIQYQGPSTQVTIVNGQMSSSVAFNYSILPLKVGKFEIPPLEVDVDNQKFKTELISLEVVQETATNSGASSPSGQPEAATLKDKIFLQLHVPKTDVYLNEKVPVKILLFVSGVNVGDIQYPQLETTGFTLSNYGRPQQFNQAINGVRYDIVEFDAVLYPTRTGELKLGPAKMECNLLVRNSRQNRANSMIDDDFFNAFFDHQEKRAVTIKSNELALQVKDLPSEGKPQNFSGGVGEYTFDVSVSPTDVKVGDPVTLKMSVQGIGNLSAVNFPLLNDEGDFKVYDPTIKEEGGAKKLEQVIIPKTKDVKEVPVFQFSYFDTNLQKYVTVAKGPFPIHVSESETGSKPGIVTSVNQEPQASPTVKDMLGEDIVFIKEAPGKIYDKGEYFYNQIWFYLLIIVLIGSFIGFLIYYQMTHRLRNDQTYARKLHAPKYAKAGLELARRCLAEKRTKEFYDAIFKTLQIYLSHKYSVSLGEINFERVQGLIKGSGQQEVLADLKFILDDCDRIRYSSGSAQESEMKLVLNKLEKSIDSLERLKT